MPRRKRSRQYGHRRQAHWNRAQSDLPFEPLPQLAQLLLEAAVAGENTVRPRQHPLALNGEPHIPLAALDDEHAEAFFELLNAGRQRRLSYVARGRRASEVTLFGEGG